jgi:Tfp pilus assembly protein PilF
VALGVPEWISVPISPLLWFGGLVFAAQSRIVELSVITMTDMQVQVGSGGRKHTLKRMLPGLGILLLVVVVALAAGGGVRWWQQQKTKDRPPVQVVAKEVTQAQNQAISGDFDKAHETVKKALDKPSLSSQERYDLLMQQGLTYESQKNYSAAMESFRAAEALKKTMDVAQCIARMADSLGDKQLAITYYKKAITLIPEDDVMKDSLKKYFNNNIIVLEGGQPAYE